MDTEKNWKLVLAVIGAIAVVLVLFLVSGRNSSPNEPQSQDLPLPTMTSSSATTTPMDKLIEEELQPPRSESADATSSTTAAPPGCRGEECHGAENRDPIDGWREVVTGFSAAYGTIGNKTKEQWLDGIQPYVSPGLLGRLSRTDYDGMKPGGNAEIRLVNSDDIHTTVCRINYPEGWSIYVQLTDRGTAFGGWQVDTIDTPRS